MCSIDWAALGTWTAVVVALWLAVGDLLRRRRTERAEAIALARMLGTEIDRLGVPTANIRKALDELIGPMELGKFLHDPRTPLAEQLNLLSARLVAFPWDSLIARAYVLGPAAATSVAESLAAFSLLRTMSEGADPQKNIDAAWTTAEAFRTLATDAIEKAKIASKSCQDITSKSHW